MTSGYVQYGIVYGQIARDMTNRTISNRSIFIISSAHGMHYSQPRLATFHLYTPLPRFCECTDCPPILRGNIGAKTEFARNFVEFRAECEKMEKVGHTTFDFAMFDWSVVRLRQILLKFLAKSFSTLPRRENRTVFALCKKRANRGRNCGKFGHKL